MPHYRATPESHAVIEGDGLLLIDSGGQYLGGTTDITRVWPIGTRQRGDEARLHAGAQGHDGAVAARAFRAARCRRCSTRSRARRCGPTASTSATAPATASATSSTCTRVRRASATAMPEPHMAMEPGMITSIEPGVYRPGQWGVRIENLVLNVPAARPRQHVRRVPRIRDADAVPDRHRAASSARCCAPTRSTGSTPTTPRCASGWRRACRATRWPGCCERCQPI